MKSPVVKRSVVVAGTRQRESRRCILGVLKEIAGNRQTSLSDLIAVIDSQRQHSNLSSAIRLFVLDFYRTQLSESEVGTTRTRSWPHAASALL